MKSKRLTCKLNDLSSGHAVERIMRDYEKLKRFTLSIAPDHSPGPPSTFAMSTPPHPSQVNHVWSEWPLPRRGPDRRFQELTMTIALMNFNSKQDNFMVWSAPQLHRFGVHTQGGGHELGMLIDHRAGTMTGAKMTTQAHYPQPQQDDKMRNATFSRCVLHTIVIFFCVCFSDLSVWIVL